jgi:hypothetical protein
VLPRLKAHVGVFEALVVDHRFTSAPALPDDLDPAMMQPTLNELRHRDDAEGVFFRDCKWLNRAHTYLC